MLGYELRERFEKRAGLDVSAITGAGENTTGTTMGALLDFDKAAAEKGYDVVYRKLGEDTIQAMLVPNEDFDETYTYGDADFDASESNPDEKYILNLQRYHEHNCESCDRCMCKAKILEDYTENKQCQNRDRIF